MKQLNKDKMLGSTTNEQAILSNITDVEYDSDLEQLLVEDHDESGSDDPMHETSKTQGFVYPKENNQDDLQELQDCIKQQIFTETKEDGTTVKLSDEAVTEKFQNSNWSVSYNLLMDYAPPFGHNFITINESVVNPETEKEEIKIRAVIGYVGGLTSSDLFGLYTKRAKVKDESERIRTAQTIKQYSWKVLPEQVGLLLAEVNHDRQHNLDTLHPIYLPDNTDPSVTLSDEDKRRLEKYKDRSRVKTQKPVKDAKGNLIYRWIKKKGAEGQEIKDQDNNTVYEKIPVMETTMIADNPGGPTYSVLGYNCKNYGLKLLRRIGIEEPALIDLGIQIPVSGHKFVETEISNRSSADNMTWNQVKFNAGLHQSLPFRRGFGYYFNRLWYGIKSFFNLFQGLGLKHVLLGTACVFLVVTAVSIIMAATFGIAALPASAFIMSVFGANVALSVITGLGLLAGGIYGCVKYSCQFAEHWNNIKNKFFPKKIEEAEDIFQPDLFNPKYDDLKNADEITDTASDITAHKAEKEFHPNIFEQLEDDRSQIQATKSCSLKLSTASQAKI